MHPKGQKAPHGTTSRYRRHECRCEPCMLAQRDSVQDYRDRKRGRPARPVPPPARHGTRSMYRRCKTGSDGGKCEDCRRANREYQRVYMEDFRDGIRWEREDLTGV